MIYITKGDLIADTHERFIDESTADDETSPEKNELRAIDLAKTYLGRYNVGLIFNPENPVRCELLVEIISKITLYKLFRRNSPRKLSTDIKDDFAWAIKQLEKISNGAVPLNGLPPAVTESGSNVSTSIWGNISNPDFYI